MLHILFIRGAVKIKGAIQSQFIRERGRIKQKAHACLELQASQFAAENATFLSDKKGPALSLLNNFVS